MRTAAAGPLSPTSVALAQALESRKSSAKRKRTFLRLRAAPAATVHNTKNVRAAPVVVAAKPTRKKAPLVMPPSECRAATPTSDAPTMFAGWPKQELLKRRNSAPGGASKRQRGLPGPVEASLQRPARGPNKRTYGGKRTTARLVRRSSAPILDDRPPIVEEEQELQEEQEETTLPPTQPTPSSLADAPPPSKIGRVYEADVRLKCLRDHFAAVDTTCFREEKPVKWMTLDTTPRVTTLPPLSKAPAEATPEDRPSLVRQKFPSLAVAFDAVSAACPLHPAPFAPFSPCVFRPATEEGAATLGLPPGKAARPCCVPVPARVVN